MTKPRKKYRPRPALPPKGMRPKLPQDTLRTVRTIHIQHVDEIASGKATQATLRDWAESMFTWSLVAKKLEVGIPEMDEQLLMAARVCERFAKTGKILFTGPEYQLAKAGTIVMDTLAEEVDAHTANEAAIVSTAQLMTMIADERQKAASL